MGSQKCPTSCKQGIKALDLLHLLPQTHMCIPPSQNDMQRHPFSGCRHYLAPSVPVAVSPTNLTVHQAKKSCHESHLNLGGWHPGTALYQSPVKNRSCCALHYTIGAFFPRPNNGELSSALSLLKEGRAGGLHHPPTPRKSATYSASSVL